jgi:hypothetical protein
MPETPFKSKKISNADCYFNSGLEDDEAAIKIPHSKINSASKKIEMADKKRINIKRRIIGNYFLEKSIGEGTFGKVKLGTHTLTG